VQICGEFTNSTLNEKEYESKRLQKIITNECKTKERVPIGLKENTKVIDNNIQTNEVANIKANSKSEVLVSLLIR